MDIYKFIEKMMRMDDTTWARHSNPWSVYTRFSCLPLIALAMWSRLWLGWWSLIPLALSLLWAWGNPRLFGPPKHTDNWASKGTFGERILMNRRSIPIPDHHECIVNILALASMPGVFILIYGLVALDIWPTVFGIVAVILLKAWFVDRMVWLYEDMKDLSLEYQSWLKVR